MKTLPKTHLIIAILTGLALAAAACDNDDPNAPYLEFRGGGFVFNFRLAQATYGFVVVPKRPLPEGAVLVAEFENPAGGAAFTVRKAVVPDQLQYAFETPPLTGVKADTPYTAVIRVIDPGSGNVLGQYQRAFKAQIDQSVLGAKPRTAGPGYAPNPALRPIPPNGPDTAK